MNQLLVVTYFGWLFMTSGIVLGAMGVSLSTAAVLSVLGYMFPQGTIPQCFSIQNP